MSRTISGELRATNVIASLRNARQARQTTTSALRAANVAVATSPAPRPTPPAPSLDRGEVFSINFLRNETVPMALRRTLVSVALGYLVVNALVMLWLFTSASQTRAQWGQLRTALQGHAPSPESVNTLRQKTGTLGDRAKEDLDKLSAVVTMKQQQFPVGGKLAALTRTIPARTWITGLSGEREKRSLTIHAAYLINPDHLYDLPTKGWIEALRADPSFRQGLKRLDLGESSRKMQGNAEIFSFDLLAEWKD